MAIAHAPTSPGSVEPSLQELGDGLFAYVHPDGSWGWSNAGLIAADDTSMLVDTLFDYRLTRRMLDAMRPLTATRPIDALVNTHGDGDHCFGNGLMSEQARIYATDAAVEQLRSATPQLAEEIKRTDLGPELNPFRDRLFGPFEFGEVELRLPTDVFAGELALEVGGRRVELVEVAPAHTAGDAIVYVPDAGVVFTGDVLFVEGTPTTSHGSPSNWIDVCDRLLALGAHTFVPGHGPVTDVSGVRAVARYWRFVWDEARARHAAGMSSDDAALDIDLGEFEAWGDPERIATNVESVYRELEPGRPPLPREEMLLRMVRWQRRRRRRSG